MKTMLVPKGFSLIELLVVLMIMTLVMSLVGPSIDKVYTQHMAQQEVRLLKQYMRDLAVYAYTNHEDVEITLTNNRVEAVTTNVSLTESVPQSNDSEATLIADLNTPNELMIFSRDFEYLGFEEARFKALKNGVITQNSLKVSTGSAGIVTVSYTHLRAHETV